MNRDPSVTVWPTARRYRPVADEQNNQRALVQGFLYPDAASLNRGYISGRRSLKNKEYRLRFGEKKE